jgi:prepilin-type N-terminal cleavage/methylation domain-containing protein
MRKSGFTLIELSIVLVIIGLIIGGILVGQDMIHSAEIRSTIQQIDSFKTASGTFREKYHCVPGDCVIASNNGLGTNGNGDGWIDSETQTENTYFWQHLTAAKMVNGNYDGSSIATMGTPKAKLRGNFYVATDGYVSAGGRLHNMITLSVTANAAINSCNGDQCASLTPYDAFSIDQKLDDGMPSSGRAIAYGDYTDVPANNIPSEGVAGSSSDFCIANDTTPFSYNVTNSNVLCTLSVPLGL